MVDATDSGTLDPRATRRPLVAVVDVEPGLLLSLLGEALAIDDTDSIVIDTIQS